MIASIDRRAIFGLLGGAAVAPLIPVVAIPVAAVRVSGFETLIRRQYLFEQIEPRVMWNTLIENVAAAAGVSPRRLMGYGIED